MFQVFAGALFGRVPNGDVSSFFMSFRPTRGGMPACRSIPTKRRTSPIGAKSAKRGISLEGDKRQGDLSRARARVFCRALLSFGMTWESETTSIFCPTLANVPQKCNTFLRDVAREILYFLPSLCKGGWRAKRGGRVVWSAPRVYDNPSICSFQSQTPPFTGFPQKYSVFLGCCKGAFVSFHPPFTSSRANVRDLLARDKELGDSSLRFGMTEERGYAPTSSLWGSCTALPNAPASGHFSSRSDGMTGEGGCGALPCKTAKRQIRALPCIGGEGSLPIKSDRPNRPNPRRNAKSNPRATARGSVCIIEL